MQKMKLCNIYFIIYIHFENNGRMLLSDINGQPETV